MRVGDRSNMHIFYKSSHQLNFNGKVVGVVLAKDAIIAFEAKQPIAVAWSIVFIHTCKM